MPASTVTSKGQITVPRKIRERLHLAPGDRIDFVVEENGVIVVRRAQSRLGQLRGMLRNRKRKSVSVSRMDVAIAREHSRR
jgi:antitoxin PrlF